LASEKYDSSLHLNIGTGVDISIKDLAQKIAEVSGFEGEILWDTSKPDGTPRKVLEVSRIKQLGWSPRVTLEEGITSTIRWYKDATVKGKSRR
jgi:GDP-L-fucose synthase